MLFQTFIQNLADKLYTKNIILIVQKEDFEDKPPNDPILLLKHLSESQIKISTVLSEIVLMQMIENLNGKPALFLCVGNTSAQFLSKVTEHDFFS